ncbi:MAG: proton-conducting membrane transporter [Acetatifactor sp.]|nr:proton-conducting membrane transporter [Acetatifactor sp.]
MNILIILPFLVGLLTGIVLLVLSFKDHKDKFDFVGNAEDAASRKKLHEYVAIILFLMASISMAVAFSGQSEIRLFTLVDGISIFFRVDKIGAMFAVVTTVVWLAVLLYSFKYMQHEENEKRFYAFYILAYGVLMCLDFSGNLITFYMFYELMSLSTMPLVFHSGTRESIMAAYKYLFYSLAGAYCSLFGIYVLHASMSGSLAFNPGGAVVFGSRFYGGGLQLLGVFLMLIGFGAKAGMFPLHAWLTAAHPVAPSPASAALSAIIVKCGVLGIIRVLFFVVDYKAIAGTWVQYTFMTLTLITVFMGSLLAFREKVFKKRLAYSTVSQVSYILFGLSTFDPAAFTGSLLHVVAHAFIKCGLFLTAGIFLFRTKETMADGYVGIGKRMPVTLWSYTICSLGLIGIPPTAGFISKWYLATGALDAGIGAFRYVGPAVLLVSALLTAGYLLPITMKGFFPGEGFEVKEKDKFDIMTAMLLLMAVLAFVLGLFPNPLTDFAGSIVSEIM